MALPSAWTEASLLAALEREVEAVLTPLGLDESDLLATVVGEDVPAVLGVLSVADWDYAAVADVVKVRTIAQWRAWQRAYEAVLLNVDLVSSGDSIKRSQAWDHLKERLAQAETQALRYTEVQATLAGTSGYAVLTSIADSGPYAPYRCTEWG